MDIEKLHNSLDSGSNSNSQRDELIAYLKTTVNTLPSNDDERRNVAYDIASLLSTHFAQSLSSDDILDDILTLAGELEVPNENNADQWAEFTELIRKL